MIKALLPVQRLALAYAPAASRPGLLALLALDARLAGIVRHSREPMLAQLRLAWWREQLATMGDKGESGGGDPLLASIRVWPGSRAPLVGLVDGWEAMVGEAPLPASAFAPLAEARASAFAALAASEQEAASAMAMARAWALADIADRLSDPREREAALALVQAQDWRARRLGRGLRSLCVLHALAARAVSRKAGARAGFVDLLVAMRVGLFGR